MPKRISLWREAFCDDTVGIRRTLEDLLWNYAAVRIAIQIVSLSGEKAKDQHTINQMIFDLAAEGYRLNLFLGIRRILDGNYELYGTRGVYSLRAVLKDIRCCRLSLTRRAYVESVREAQYDLERLKLESQKNWNGAPRWGDLEIPKSERSHRDFDVLSGVSEDARTPDDLIDDTVFIKIDAKLDKLRPILDYVNSNLAHAGTPGSREGKDLENFDIGKAREALKTLKEIADEIGALFANSGGSGLAVHLGDQFEGLDKPLVDTAEIDCLEKLWQGTDRDIASWRQSVEDLLA